MMRNWFTLPLIVLMSLSLAACGKAGSMELGNGAYSVTAPKGVSFSCTTLQHASDCENYNVPGSIEGMEVRMCHAESKNTKFLVVNGKLQTALPPSQGEDMSAWFVAGWSKCQDGKISNPQQITIDGKSGTDYVLSTPLGEGASRAFVDKEYSVMVLAVPKYSGSKDEIDGFVKSLRPATAK